MDNIMYFQIIEKLNKIQEDIDFIKKEIETIKEYK